MVHVDIAIFHSWDVVIILVLLVFIYVQATFISYPFLLWIYRKYLLISTNDCCLQRYRTCSYADHTNNTQRCICPTLIVSSTTSTPITLVTPSDPPRSLTGDTRTRISWLPVRPSVCLSASLSDKRKSLVAPLSDASDTVNGPSLSALPLPLDSLPPPPTPTHHKQHTPKLTLVLYPCLQTRFVFAVLSRMCIFWFTDHFILTMSQALLILWVFKIRVMLLGSLVSQVTPKV